MNERIKEISDQVWEWAENQEYSGPDQFSDIWETKFAELIVQEMLGLLEQYSRDSFPEDTIDDFDKGYLAGLYTARNAVKKHFGVEL